MSKKKKSTKQEVVNQYYDLKTDAIDALVGAENDESETVSQEELNHYRGKSKGKVPEALKIALIKFWFAGAVCFFIYWGLGLYVWDAYDMIIILGVVSGMVTDILVNNAFRFLAVVPDGNNKWMMFPKKKFWTFFANIIYSMIIMVIIVCIYQGINILCNNINGTEKLVYLGVEPILFGIFYVIIDLLFIGIKHLVIGIIKDAKEKAEIHQ